MPVFKDPVKLAKYLKIALDVQVAETLITTQSKLGSAAVSPIDTGRFRSSWFASEGTPSTEVAPEAEAKAVKRLRKRQAKAAAEGTGAGSRGLSSYGAQADASELKVDSSKTYYLTNNLPYAQAITIGQRVVSKHKNWWFDFLNVTVPKIQNGAARVVKGRFQL